MNYIGSKIKLCEFLRQNISETLREFDAKPLQQSIFCDLFSGTAAVGRLFKSSVKQIISNDKEFYAYALAKNYIGNHTPLLRANELLIELNDEQKTPLVKGKIFTHYALGGGNNRQYFSDFNAMKIDAIRQKIALWKERNFINEQEYFFLLASLLECADKVANTACVYGAFLKRLKNSARTKLVLNAAKFECNENEHLCFNDDALALISKIKGDILYLDPPYNAREYGANYHLLNSIALYDDFVPQGKTGLREYERSPWCKKAAVASELEALLEQADFGLIFLSYNDEGLLGLDELAQICKKFGDYLLKAQPHKRFKADSKRYNKKDETIEYLHTLRKKDKK